MSAVADDVAAAPEAGRDGASRGVGPVAPDELTAIGNRLKRAQGQLGAIVRMLEEGRDCEDVVTQLAAVGRAIDRAGFAVIASGMRQCMLAPGAGDDGAEVDVRRLEKLFLSLA